MRRRDTSKQRLWLGTGRYRCGCWDAATDSASAYAHANAECDAMRAGDANANTDCDGYRDSNSYAYCHNTTISNTHTERHHSSNAYTYGDGHSYSSAKGNPEASANSASSALI
jgi:hypothetical protein